jgi:DNA polymerase-3 subunit alpha
VVVEEYQLALWIMDEGRKRGIPVVATNDAHYLTRDDGDAHDTLLCLQTGGWKHKGERMMYPGVPEGLFEFYVKTEEEMVDMWPNEGWVQACANTNLVVEMVEDDVIPRHKLIMPRFELPRDAGFRYWQQTGTFLL